VEDPPKAQLTTLDQFAMTPCTLHANDEQSAKPLFSVPPGWKTMHYYIVTHGEDNVNALASDRSIGIWEDGGRPRSSEGPSGNSGGSTGNSGNRGGVSSNSGDSGEAGTSGNSGNS
jgi:uncharacterized membrane protein YgcG